jgi:hypothetical protein
MSQTKWRAGDDVLGDDNVFDSPAKAMQSVQWELLPDGLWYQAGDEEGCTEKEVMALEEIREVRQFKIGASGTVRVSYETTVWAVDEDQALDAAAQLPDMLSGSSFEMTEPPDSNDFDPWAKVQP